MTSFWNTKNFMRNGRRMNPEFQINEVQLNSNVFQRQAYLLRTNKISFYNSRFLNAPYMPNWDAG